MAVRSDYRAFTPSVDPSPVKWSPGNYGRKLVVCHEPRRRREDHGVEIVPVQEFMDALWAGEIVE